MILCALGIFNFPKDYFLDKIARTVQNIILRGDENDRKFMATSECKKQIQQPC